MLALHPTETSAALIPALWTGQLQGDLLKAAWTNYDGQALLSTPGQDRARVAVLYRRYGAQQCSTPCQEGDHHFDEHARQAVDQ